MKSGHLGDSETQSLLKATRRRERTGEMRGNEQEVRGKDKTRRPEGGGASRGREDPTMALLGAAVPCGKEGTASWAST